MPPPREAAATLYNYLLAVIGCHQSFYSTTVGSFLRLMKGLIKTLLSQLLYSEKSNEYNKACMYTVVYCSMVYVI